MSIIAKYKTEAGELQVLETKTRYGTRYYWRTTSRNGEEIGRNSENYERLQGCLRSLRAEIKIIGNLPSIEEIACDMGIKL